MWLGVLEVRLVDGSHLTYVQIHNSKVLGYGFGTPTCISVFRLAFKTEDIMRIGKGDSRTATWQIDSHTDERVHS